MEVKALWKEVAYEVESLQHTLRLGRMVMTGTDAKDKLEEITNILHKLAFASSLRDGERELFAHISELGQLGRETETLVLERIKDLTTNPGS